jgi:hypothetical protein
MSGPFKHGLVFAFTFSAILYIVAAVTSWLGGDHVEDAATAVAEPDAYAASRT